MPPTMCRRYLEIRSKRFAPVRNSTSSFRKPSSLGEQVVRVLEHAVDALAEAGEVAGFARALGEDAQAQTIRLARLQLLAVERLLVCFAVDADARDRVSQELLLVVQEALEAVRLVEAEADQVEAVVELRSQAALGELAGLHLDEDHLPTRAVGEVHRDDVRLLERRLAHEVGGEVQEVLHDRAFADPRVPDQRDLQHVPGERLLQAPEVAFRAADSRLLSDVHDVRELLLEADVVEVLVRVGVVRVGQVAADPRLPPEHLPVGHGQAVAVGEGRVLLEVRFGEGWSAGGTLHGEEDLLELLAGEQALDGELVEDALDELPGLFFELDRDEGAHDELVDEELCRQVDLFVVAEVLEDEPAVLDLHEFEQVFVDGVEAFEGDELGVEVGRGLGQGSAPAL